MKRRDFIKNTGIAAVSSSVMLGGMQIAKSNPMFDSLLAQAEAQDKILILIFLNGGNDGLNTVIPIDQYSNLYNNRSNVLVPENLILKLRDNLGLHPALSGMRELYDNGKLHILQSVGYPSPNFSHFRSTDIWTSASDADQVETTGWLGRYLYTNHTSYPEGYPNEQYPDPLSLTYGPFVSPTCQGPAMGMGMAITGTNIYNITSGGEDVAPDSPAGDELDYIRTVIDQTQIYSETLENAADKGSSLLSDKWPADDANSLAQQMKITAQLISGGMNTKIYVHNISGFDTHANQVQAEGQVDGFHNLLLTQVSEAISAFQDEMELQSLDNRVVGMTFSEFGRRILSNGSNGTDHGSAAPLFVFGSNVIPNIQGENPEIPRNATVQDNLPMQYDFRSVYYSLLKDWFEVNDDSLNEIMFKEFQHLEIIKKQSTNVEDFDRINNSLSVYPNPVIDDSTVKFKTNNGYTKVSLYNNRGQEIKVLFYGYTEKVEKSVQLNAAELNSGSYHIRLQSGNYQTTKMVNVIK